MEMKLAAILFMTVLGFGLVATSDKLLDALASARDAWKSPMVTVDACKAKEGVTDEAIRDIGNTSVTELSKEAKCFLACAAEKFELVVDGKMSSDNIIQMARIGFANVPDNIAKQLPIVEAAVNACADEAGALKLDRCELAGHMRSCYLKAGNSLMKA